MERIPFGISRLDSTIGGGAPRGSVVLLSGEAGAGAREFVYTSAVMHGLAGTGDELFALHYGTVASNATLPEAVHYLSFTAERDQIESELALSIDATIGERGFEPVRFCSLSEEYFHHSPVPRAWYADRTEDITRLRSRHEKRQGLLGALGDYLGEHAAGNLVIIDSLSDLVGALGETFEWADLSYFVRGLASAAHQWGSLVLIHVNHETLTDTQHGHLVDACSGTLQFRWETGGSARARTLVIRSFRGVLSQIEAEDVVTFETELGEAGFDVSDVRKIR